MEEFNLKCEMFKQQLIELLNTCELPISSAFYIYQIVFNDLEKEYYATLNTESMKQQQTITVGETEEQEEVEKEIEE